MTWNDLEPPKEGFWWMFLAICGCSAHLDCGLWQNDFEWPWTPKIAGFSEFFAISGCDTHFKSELCQNGWR